MFLTYHDNEVTVLMLLIHQSPNPSLSFFILLTTLKLDYIPLYCPSAASFVHYNSLALLNCTLSYIWLLKPKIRSLRLVYQVVDILANSSKNYVAWIPWIPLSLFLSSPAPRGQWLMASSDRGTCCTGHI